MRVILDATRNGDAQAAAVVEEIAVFLGSAIATIVAVLDPALVVFGGGLSHAGPLLVEPVRRVVTRIVPNVPAIETSALGDDASLLGAVSSAMEAAEARLLAIESSPGVSAASASLASSALVR